MPVEALHPAAAVDESRDDRAVEPFGAAPRRVFVHRRHQPGAVAHAPGGACAEGPFHARPPVVFAAGAGARLEVQLLPIPSAHITDPQISRQAIEGDAPGIAQPRSPDQVVGAGVPEERVVSGHVRKGQVHVEAQELAEELVRVLGRGGDAAVPHGVVELAVRSEADAAAVVVGCRLRQGPEDRGERGRVDDVRNGGVAQVLADHRVAGQVRVADVELAVGRIVGVEGEAKQPALA